LEQLRGFQRAARAEFAFGHEHSYVATIYDNVWARFNAIEPGTPSLVLDLAGHAMKAALAHGFPHFFGCITRGMHEFDPNDRMLVGGENFEDLREQHIDVTSEPHIRAAHAERWSRLSAFPRDCVWVSSEVLDLKLLPAECSFPDSTVAPFGETFDISHAALRNGERWKFSPSQFRAVRTREAAQ